MRCPVCQELLRRAREEAEHGPSSLAPSELSRRGVERPTLPLILDLLGLAIVALATFWTAAWGTAGLLSAMGASGAPKTTGVVVVDCARDKDLCSTLLSAGVVAAGDAEEE